MNVVPSLHAKPLGCSRMWQEPFSVQNRVRPLEVSRVQRRSCSYLVPLFKVLRAACERSWSLPLSAVLSQHFDRKHTASKSLGNGDDAERRKSPSDLRFFGSLSLRLKLQKRDPHQDTSTVAAVKLLIHFLCDTFLFFSFWKKHKGFFVNLRLVESEMQETFSSTYRFSKQKLGVGVVLFLHKMKHFQNKMRH